MNQSELLQMYEQVADAPDAVGKLRQFVLELAVSGKLTAYAFRAEEVISLGTRAEFIMGQAPPGSECNDRGIGTPFVKVGEFGQTFPVLALWTTKPLKMARLGDVLICVVGATVGKLNLAIDSAIGRSVAAIRPDHLLDQHFLYLSLKPYTARLRADSRGTAQGVIGRKELHEIKIWSPPLAEQHRIVAKVDELMTLCDQLETARTEREAARDRLAAASLSRLNAPDPDTFQSDAHFALDVLPALSARPDQVKPLRQTILNLAVRGKLVPQDPRDEPAHAALARLSSTGATDSRARGRVAPDAEVSASSAEGRFQLPDGWRWCAALEVCSRVESGSTPPANEMFEGRGDVPFIKVYNLTKTGVLDFSVRPTFISRTTHETRLSRSRIVPGDVLMNIVGPPLGKVSIVPNDFDEWNTNQAVVLFRPQPILLSQYLTTCLRSEAVLSWLVDLAQQTVGQVNISVGKSRRLPLPLPPLAEQRRIIEKVDELMTICDELETLLSTGESTRSRLLDALLHEALEPLGNAA